MMIDLLTYLLKVSAGLAIIGLPYYFLLRNDPNLLLKRVYLLLGIAAAWIFPLLVFRKPEVIMNFTPTIFIDPLQGDPLALNELVSGTQSSDGRIKQFNINWLQLALYAYLTGLVLLTIKNLTIIFRWNLEWRRRNENGIAFIPSDQVFTLFTRIFIPESLRDEKDLDHLILHEQAHVEQLHFIDLMLMELTLLLTWFNPFSWLISRMIKENHEHLADRQVLSAGVSAARYRAQLMNHTLGVNVFRLGNQFNHSLTLNRFKMMKKPRKSPAGIAKLTFLVPVLLLAMALTTGMTPQKERIVSGTVIEAESGEAMPGTSIVVKGGTRGCVADLDGSFTLSVEGDPELVFSFVGYETRVLRASKIGNKAVGLSSTVTSYDLDDTSTGGIKFSASNGVSIDDKADNPVIVLDGEVVLELDQMDPEDIEKIQVIKDPEHELTKKYNAENGVIIITTKEATYVSDRDQTQIKLSSSMDDPDDEVFFIVEDMPMFPGGKAALKSYIYTNLEYPGKAKKKGVEAELFVQFTITTKGELKDIKVVKSNYTGTYNKEFEQAALAVFESMPAWKPGKQRGKSVNVKVVIPVKFSPDQEL